VDLIYFDYRVTLQFGGGSRVEVESPFTIHGLSEHPIEIEPEAVANPGAVLAALHQRAVDVSIGDSSELTVRLSNSTWIIPADDHYESWHLHHGEMNLTCPAGGLF